MKFKRILVKVGTNVLTREDGRLDYNRIVDLVDQISTLKKEMQVVLVSSGAAGAGREYFQFPEEKDPLIRKQMLASIGQGRLFQIYADFLREQGVIPAQALITRTDFSHKLSYENMRTTLEGLLAHGILPIINENDVVSSRESSFGDNDQLAALTACLMQVDLMVVLSNIPGFYTADPTTNPEAKLIPRVDQISEDLLAMCENSLSKGGTGGMLSKLKAAEFATQHGIPAIVTNGKEGKNLLKAVRGEPTGTYFSAMTEKKNLPSRGQWMVTGADVKGTLTVDDGAEKALRNNKSLLMVGVKAVEGDFEKRAVVLVQNKQHIRLGAGLINYDAAELRALLKQEEKQQGIVVIHKNHLYTL